MWADVLHSGTAISIRGLYAEPSFFDIFSYPLLAGDPETALNEPYSIIISEETAQKFFGEGEPMHKTLTIEKLGDFTVTGILKKLNRKSHFRFDALASFAALGSLENSGGIETEMHSWSSFKRFYTYVLLKNKDDRTNLNEQLPENCKGNFPRNGT